MPAATFARRWTIASWQLTGFDDDTELVAGALAPYDTDAIMLQDVGEGELHAIVRKLRGEHRWSLSHYPVSRLIPGSSVGLGVITDHTVSAQNDVVISDDESKWSSTRRIAQAITVQRDDSSEYTIVHADTTIEQAPGSDNAAPIVQIRPELVAATPEQAVWFPDEATVVSIDATEVVDGKPPLLVFTFELNWVKGDFDFFVEDTDQDNA